MKHSSESYLSLWIPAVVIGTLSCYLSFCLKDKSSELHLRVTYFLLYRRDTQLPTEGTLEVPPVCNAVHQDDYKTGLDTKCPKLGHNLGIT